MRFSNGQFPGHTIHDDKWLFQTQCGSALVDRPDKPFAPRRTALAVQSIGQKNLDFHPVPSSNASPVETHVFASQPENRSLRSAQENRCQLMGYGQYSANQKINLKQSGEFQLSIKAEKIYQDLKETIERQQRGQI